MSGVVMCVCDDSVFGTGRASFGGDGGRGPGIRDEPYFFEIVAAAAECWDGVGL